VERKLLDLAAIRKRGEVGKGVRKFPDFTTSAR
jgi:hypothetical protein